MFCNKQQEKTLSSQSVFLTSLKSPTYEALFQCKFGIVEMFTLSDAIVLLSGVWIRPLSVVWLIWKNAEGWSG